MALLIAVLGCYRKTFTYRGAEGRAAYSLFLLLQSFWFSLYLKHIFSTPNTIGVLPLLLFILPLLSLASRRINDAGYSHWLFIGVLFAPYLFFIFLCFPKSSHRKARQ